jgi:hypothetical protein
LTEKGSWSKETLLRVAEDFGLDIDAFLLQDLYAYLKGLYPTLKAIEDLDLSGLEPFMPSFWKKEWRS